MFVCLCVCVCESLCECERGVRGLPVLPPSPSPPPCPARLAMPLYRPRKSQHLRLPLLPLPLLPQVHRPPPRQPTLRTTGRLRACWWVGSLARPHPPPLFESVARASSILCLASCLVVGDWQLVVAGPCIAPRLPESSLSLSPLWPRQVGTKYKLTRVQPLGTAGTDSARALVHVLDLEV